MLGHFSIVMFERVNVIVFIKDNAGTNKEVNSGKYINI